MGIQDRDYMKRPPDDESLHPSSTDNKLEEFLSGFLARHPRLFLYVGIGLLALVILAFIMVKISGNRQ